jgi:putative chitobiose transport system substrate-binding protein
MAFTKKTFQKIIIFLLLLLILVPSLMACGDTPVAPPPTVQIGLSTVAPSVAPSATDSAGINSGVGQGNQASVPQGRTIITIWTAGWKGNIEYEKSLAKTIDDYRRLYPLVTFDWRDFAGDLPTQLEKTWAGTADKKDTAPDLVLLSPSDFYQFAASGRLEQLNEYSEFASKQADYLAPALETCKIGNNYYCFPWLASTRITLINKKLWQQAGQDLTKLPKTYEELEAVLPTLARRTPDNVRAAWIKPDPLADFLLEDIPLYSGAGRNIIPAFNNPVTQARWGFYQTNLRNGALVREAIDTSSQEAMKKFMDGKMVVWLDGGDQLYNLKSSSPTFYSQSVSVILNPTAKPGILPYQSKGVWAISSQSKQKSRAVDFASFIANGQNQLSFARAMTPYTAVPTVKKSLEDTFISDTSEPLGQARNLIAGAMVNTKPLEKMLPYPLPTETRDKLLKALLDAQSKMWSGQLQPAQALFEADKAWQDLLRL